MKKVVAVDDYVDFVEMEKLFIESFNKARCTTFTNPVNAYDYINKFNDIDVVISDYDMPQMNGFELAKKIFKIRPNIRVIILSGESQERLKQIAQSYNLLDKVEFATKGNTEFLRKLF